jgi:hypothetical protein
MAERQALGGMPPNQHKLGGDTHMLTRRATVVVTDIFPLTKAEPTILTYGNGFLSSGGAIETFHVGCSSSTLGLIARIES